MQESPQTDVESLPPTTQTSSSCLTQNSHSNSSTRAQPRPAFFQTIKKEPKNNTHLKKKRKLFETTNNKTTADVSADNQADKVKNFPKFRENYLDLLIAAATIRMESGDITEEYLNSPTFPKFSDFSYSSNEEETYSKKCENKICAVVVDNPTKIYHAKFLSSQAFKAHSLWLCDKCYYAYRLGNYCYYCNVIYRDFSFNQQYYDRKKWIQCDYCQKWQHMLCEEKKGKFENLEELALNSNFKYMCPFCRKENAHLLREYNKFEKGKFLFNYFNNNLEKRKNAK